MRESMGVPYVASEECDVPILPTSLEVEDLLCHQPSDEGMLRRRAPLRSVTYHDTQHQSLSRHQQQSHIRRTQDSVYAVLPPQMSRLLQASDGTLEGPTTTTDDAEYGWPACRSHKKHTSDLVASHISSSTPTLFFTALRGRRICYTRTSPSSIQPCRLSRRTFRRPFSRDGHVASPRAHM